jgi:hypothetical protein
MSFDIPSHFVIQMGAGGRNINVTTISSLVLNSQIHETSPVSAMKRTPFESGPRSCLLRH